MLCRPRPLAMRRTSAVRGSLSKALPSRSSGSMRPRSAVQACAGRRWFKCCVVASRKKYSTAAASHPVTSRASCSSTAAVPLRRRYAIVFATSARELRSVPCAAVQPAVSDEITDVRHRPVGARLDEEIVVELVDVLLDRAELLGNDGEQFFEHLTLRRIAHAVDRRQQRVEGFGIVMHDVQALAFMTVRASGRASSSSSSAARSPVAPVRGGAAASAVSSVARLIDTMEHVEIDRHDSCHGVDRRHDLAARDGL